MVRSKTTTLSMLTGDTEPTTGQLVVAGVPLDHPQFYQHIGYCPQVDPLLELMTAYETLFFFGRIRGIPVDELNRRVDTLVEQVGLAAHDRPWNLQWWQQAQDVSRCGSDR